MTRQLHWILCLGCAGLLALHAGSAWDAVHACELPRDCRPAQQWLQAFLGAEEAPQTERLGALEPEEEPAPGTARLVADRS